MTLVIHHNCVDGFAGAWAASKALQGADFLPAAYHPDGAPLEPPEVDGRDVLIVDFSYPRNVLIEMASRANSLLVLDHHESARKELEGLDFALLDMERSGCAMAWDHFFPNSERPWLIEYVEDRDLWTFVLPESKAVNAYLQALERDFATFDRVLAEGVGIAMDRGRWMEIVRADYVSSVAELARPRLFAGHTVPFVNAPFWACSELVGQLAEGADFAVGWWQRADGRFQYSLRSKGGFDVSELARAYGGGGHRGAAGFVSKHPPDALALSEWLDDQLEL